MAGVPAFTINNYIPKLSNEVIELDEDLSTTPRKNIKFPTGRYNARVSPTPSYDNYIDSKLGSRKRYSVILVISFLLSLVSFVLVCGVVIGFIQPMNAKDSKQCQCVSSKSNSGTSGALKLEPTENDDTQRRQEIQRDVDRIKETLGAQNEKMSSFEVDINYIHNKLQKMNGTLVNLTQHFSNQFARHKQKLDRNFTEVSKNIENILGNVTKLTLSQFRDEDHFRKISKNISKLHVKLDKYVNETRKLVTENEIQYNAKFNKLSKESWKNTSKVSEVVENNYENVKKFVNDTRQQILETQSISKTQVKMLKQEIQTDLTKVVQKTDNISMDLQKFSIHTTQQFATARNATENKYQRLQTKSERNITFLSQKMKNIAFGILTLRNDTDKKLQSNFNNVKQLLDPSKFRGPRGYNGTVGQPGPRGPTGSPGPPTTLNFTKCKHESKVVTGNSGATLKFVKSKDTKTDIMFAVVCESSVKATVTKKTTRITEGFQHTCYCSNHESKPTTFTCTIKFLLCKR